MKSRLLSNGCSFNTPRPKDGVETFVSKELAEHYNLEHTNLAMRGRGNKRIGFTTKWYFELEKEAGKEENKNGESKNDEVPIESAFNLDEFQSQLEAEGWMSDAEWKKFGIRQGSDYISEKVMTDIASRWDDDRLRSWPQLVDLWQSQRGGVCQSRPDGEYG